MAEKKVTDGVRKKVHELRKQGLTKTAVGTELGICRQSVTHIEDGTYDLRFLAFRNRYQIQPLPLLDVIANKGSTTARTVAAALGYATRSAGYFRVLGTLKQLCDDKILTKTGRGGKGHPHEYAINQNHPQAYLLEAMCKVV